MPGGPRWLSNQASSGCFSADNRDSQRTQAFYSEIAEGRKEEQQAASTDAWHGRREQRSRGGDGRQEALRVAGTAFQALPDAHSSSKQPPKWTLQGQERQECGVCSEAPGSLGPRVRSRMDPVGARILTLSRLPGSPAISRAVGCLPKRRSSRKTRTHLLLWAVLGSPGPEGQEGASGRVSSSGSKA
ncbi:hypothetical protein MJG53_017698 [Ovis ammon polii x Ovis aries]|uniref:Uncharacterized protein n=2 Tax=Ovis TaxID=9935 RepID=A0A835ZQQ6_SHEEP|nr:hypothetical protein JEQ12_010853 [Ovis aries]KAI4561069.1 hypothetical protein MJG53_017698 [Ovis ammon polii x Ovis aries]